MGICPYCILLTVTFILGNKASKLDTVPLYRTDSVTFRHALLHYVIRNILYPDLIGYKSLGVLPDWSGLSSHDSYKSMARVSLALEVCPLHGS